MDIIKLTAINTVICTQNPVNWPAFGKGALQTALASATCLLGTHSNDISNPWGVVVVPEFERVPKMPHSKQG